MVVTEKDFDKLAGLYNELLRQTMLLHNVKEIICERETEHFFDRVVIYDNGSMSVYKHGLKKPFSNLCFDFTVDYAACLSYIEHDLYLARRKGKPERGMRIIFND